jgi:hypothetical protein
MWLDKVLGGRVSLPPFNFGWLGGVYSTIIWKWFKGRHGNEPFLSQEEEKQEDNWTY